MTLMSRIKVTSFLSLSTAERLSLVNSIRDLRTSAVRVFKKEEAEAIVLRAEKKEATKVRAKVKSIGEKIDKLSPEMVKMVQRQLKGGKI